MMSVLSMERVKHEIKNIFSFTKKEAETWELNICKKNPVA